MGIKFAKMHGLGNDFMVIDAVNQPINLSKNQIIQLGNRYTGIGFDQCLLIEPSQNAEIDFNYRIFNADGQEVGQCGNGARCLALFAQYYGLTTKKTLKVATKTTLMQLTINGDESVSVAMGIPKSAPSEIPFIASHEAPFYELPLKDGLSATIHVINVGNPHAVMIVEDTNKTAVDELGSQISRHIHFPEQTNAGFMQIINPEHMQLRVFERGCGETRACGSGAVAAAAIGQLHYKMADRIKVSLTGGDLIVDWPDKQNAIRLTGPAAFVYEGRLLG